MKWEYTTISIEAKGLMFYNKKFNEERSTDEINELGEKGWELVSVVPIERTGGIYNKTATYAFAFVFKRPIKEKQPELNIRHI